MSIIKYRTCEYGIDIERVECTRETEKSVWQTRMRYRIGIPPGRDIEMREVRTVKDHHWHDSWHAARLYLIERESRSLEAGKRIVEHRSMNIAALNQMQEPTE